MSKRFARRFYKSRAWERAREYALVRDGRLCQRCRAAGRLTPAVVVHHRVPLTPSNVGDPAVALDPSNLVSLCKECHELTHRELREGAFTHAAGGGASMRVGFDEFGNVVRAGGGT